MYIYISHNYVSTIPICSVRNMYRNISDNSSPIFSHIWLVLSPFKLNVHLKWTCACIIYLPFKWRRQLSTSSCIPQYSILFMSPKSIVLSMQLWISPLSLFCMLDHSIRVPYLPLYINYPKVKYIPGLCIYINNT